MKCVFKFTSTVIPRFSKVVGYENIYQMFMTNGKKQSVNSPD